MSNHKLTPADFLKEGYTRYDTQGLNREDYLLQKAIKDEFGRKYYINVYVYEHFKKVYFEHQNDLHDYGFAPQVNFNFDDDTIPVVRTELIMNHSAPQPIKMIEDTFEKIWKAIGAGYYEKFH